MPNLPLADRPGAVPDGPPGQRPSSEGVAAARRAWVLPRVGLAFINLAWAAGYPLTAVALRDFSPSLLTVIRLGLSAVICLPLLRRVSPGSRWNRRSVALAAVLGIFGFAVPVYLQTVGLALSTPAVTAILVATEPLFTAVIAAAFLGERLPRVRAVALGVALAGAWTIAGAPRPGHLGYLWGEAVLLLSTICFSAYNAVSSRLTASVGAPAATSAVLLAGFAGSLPLWGMTAPTLPTHAQALPVVAAAFLAVVCTGGGYLIWMYAIDRMPVAQVALFLYLQPVFGSALSSWLAGRAPHAAFCMGAGLVLGGVFLGEHGPALNRPNAPAPETASRA